jgi:tetratricopeptide (TPR) repeat protein
VVNEDVTFLEGKCLSYSRGVAYHPVIDILKGNFDIGEDDGDEVVRDKVHRGLKILDADDAATAPYLLELLSVKDSGIENIPMSPEARKDRTIQALNRIVLKGSEIRPLILSVEDLHWLDLTSEDVFKDLLERIAGARVLLLFTYRPEYEHSWSGRSYHSQVNLNRLSKRETVAMVTHLLDTEAVPENLVSLVLQKSEGVPFFIEEFVKSLKDLRIIDGHDHSYVLTKDPKDRAIPSTIQDVLMARVDALPDGAKEVLQTGSVIEREFSHELIQKVTDLSERELLSHISVLKEAELLYERGLHPHAAYVFKHALTREVLYESALQKKKKHLHERIATIMEDIHKGNINEYCETLCEHFVAGENFEKGAHYSRLASKKAMKTGSYSDAIAYLRKCISSLESLPVSNDVDKKRVSARTSLGIYCIQQNFHSEAKKSIDPIVRVALDNKYTDQLSKIYVILGTHSFFIEEDFQKGFEELEKAIRISEKEDDSISIGQSNYWFGWALALDCQFDRALHHFERMVMVSRAANYTWAIGNTKAVMALFVYCTQGRVKSAYQASQEALRAAEESGDIWSKGLAYSSHGISCYYRGNLDEAQGYLAKGIDFCEKSNQLGWTILARNALGATFYQMGDHQNSISQYDCTFDPMRKVNYSPSFINTMKIGLAKATAIKEKTYTNVDQLYEFHVGTRLKAFEGPTARSISEVLLSLGEHSLSEAENWIRKAIETNEKNRMRWDVAMDHVVYAGWHQRKGDHSRAREHLKKAIEIFQECGADGWVKRTEDKLAEL